MHYKIVNFKHANMVKKISPLNGTQILTHVKKTKCQTHFK